MATQTITPVTGRRYGPSSTVACERAQSGARACGSARVAARYPRVAAGPQRPSNGPRSKPRTSLPSRRRVAAPVRCLGVEQSYRMGRWTHLAMTLIVVAAVVVAVIAIVAPAAVPTTRVTVGPGDTLLSIALRDMPGADPVEGVRQIERLNGLSGSDVVAGAVLLVPSR